MILKKLKKTVITLAILKHTQTSYANVNLIGGRKTNMHKIHVNKEFI